MNKKLFFYVVAVIFLLQAVFHFFRLMFNIELIVNGENLATWISGSLVILGTFLSYQALRFSKE
jgi:uncharacterized membrane protein